jgi:hypothetical protein
MSLCPSIRKIIFHASSTVHLDLVLYRRRSSSRHLDCFEAARLVNAGRSLPIENVNQVPRVPDKIHLQLSLLISSAGSSGHSDTVEVRSSSLLVPTISFNHLPFLTTLPEAPSGSTKRIRSRRLATAERRLFHTSRKR